MPSISIVRPVFASDFEFEGTERGLWLSESGTIAGLGILEVVGSEL